MNTLGIESLKPVDFLGFYLPPPFLWALVALVPFLVVRHLLSWSGAYSFIWHRPLFDTALFVVILGALILSGGTRWL